ncbi:F-box protein SKIP8-like [Pyrus communis]|uniref:F-box protein SKIP8-like n=1 Tax=Pyrus communis TaxID=23211 RepID=UPI0035C04237
MEIISLTLSSPQTFFVALIFTFLTFFLALLAVRSLPGKPKLGGAASATSSSSRSGKACTCCTCHREEVVSGSDSGPVSAPHLNGGTGTDLTEKPTAAAAVLERHTGPSMMEQLVPEITTHALSYLDYPSLCRLSMTNWTMRKAANDDNAWKALYHKDFTLEQDSVTPVKGWKAYYAATRAIVNVNTEFFNFIRGRSLPEMSRLWLNADYVKCVHASGELFSGYNAVIQSWQLAFNWEQGVNFQIRDVRARVLTDMAWVTMKTYVEIETGPFSVTNVYEFHNGRWYMVHHHSSVMDVEGEQQIVHG